MTPPSSEERDGGRTDENGRRLKPAPHAASDGHASFGNSECGWTPRRPVLAAAAIYLVLTLLVFGHVLFGRPDLVLSDRGGDLRLQYVQWREFGFGQLRQGHFPLWNPHIYSGVPYFGGFQSGLLYPLNAQYLLLPTPQAVNVGIVLHVFLAGLFMFLWARGRGLSFVPSAMAGALWMFCGEHFLHIYAGHLCRLVTTAWIPMLFLCLDRFIERRTLGWALGGAGVIALMLVGGDPQYVFYSAVAAGLYCVLRLWSAERRWQAAAGLAVICVTAAGLAAVQLLTGLATAQESIRGAGTSWEFASSFSFPPENLATLIAPLIFGDATGYWGRWHLWEMCLFLSVTGLLLAGVGAARGEKRERRVLLIMTGALLLLALGAYTPLYRLLYDWVPGFDKFRGMSKFAVPASAFLIMLSATGLEALLRGGGARRLAYAVAATGAVLVAAGVWMATASGSDAWAAYMRHVAAIRESLVSAAAMADAGYVRRALHHAGVALLWSGATCMVIATVLAFVRSRERLAFALGALAALEVAVFASVSVTTFPIGETRAPSLQKLLASRPGDYRVLITEFPNLSITLGARDIWGYGPFMPRRYGEFMTFSQGKDPSEASPAVVFLKHHPFYDLLRCRYAIVRQKGYDDVYEHPDALPHAVIAHDCRVLSGREAILEALVAPGFDARRTVILESPPAIAPQPAAGPEAVRVTEEGTDALRIEARLTSPGIVLITDSYARGWRATDERGKECDVMPADHTLRALALPAGDHRIRMEYQPAAFRVGAAVSALFAAGYLAAVAVWWRRRRNRTAGQPGA